jgi:hypothetical protein
MLYLFLVVFALIVGGFIRGLRDTGEFGLFISFIGCLCLIPLAIVHCVFVADHCEEIALIRSSQPIIAIHEQAIEDLDRQMDGLSKSIGSQAVFNADSPYRSLIEAKTKYVSKLASAKSGILNAKVSISARKLGMMSYIVRWYGEE